jgi:dTDP-4-amino-4,6-dideoxygalactose transaminase
MKVPLVDLGAQYLTIKEEMDRAVLSVLENGQYVLGPNVKDLEQEIASYLGSNHAVGLASGTDALIIALRALGVGEGDEVIIPAFSFFATAGAVLSVGARPLFVDVDPQTYLLDVNKLEAAVTPTTKAIIPVHLYGQPANMDEIIDIAKKHNLKVIEDNAQAIGSTYKGTKTASIGDVGCLSFFPSKNLGGYGDGGMLITNDDRIAETAIMLRTHGWKKKYFPEVLGYNSRLDEIQAAILRVKLKRIDRWNLLRCERAREYSSALTELGLRVPVEAPDRTHVFHLYMVAFEERDAVQKHLKEAGVANAIYYPQPLHLAKPCRKLGYTAGQFPVSEQASRELLALPMYPELEKEQQSYVVETIKDFVNRNA